MELIEEIKNHAKVFIAGAVVVAILVAVYMWMKNREGLVNLSTLSPEAQKLVAYHEKIDPSMSKEGMTTPRVLPRDRH